MTGESVSSAHTDIGAYALGLLEAADRQAFEEHLAGCPACAAELAELSGMKSLLTGIDPVEAPGGELPGADVTALVRRRALAQRRLTRRRALLAAAASVALLAGGVGAGLAVASGPGPAVPPAVTLTGEIRGAVSPQTGVHGKVGLVSKAWGTMVTLELWKVRGPLECQLIAVSRNGERRVMVNWLVPPAGYGVPGHPARLFLQGGTALKLGDLASVQVVVVGGRTLVSIPV